MLYNYDRAIGCRIGYNAVIKAVKYVRKHGHIDPRTSRNLRRVLRAIYGRERYRRLRT